MRVTDLPDWMQKTYWYFHGPVGHPQPHAQGYTNMSGVVWFLATEFVLGICILIAFLGLDWLEVKEPLRKYLKALIAVIIGALMIVKLFTFAGV